MHISELILVFPSETDPVYSGRDQNTTPTQNPMSILNLTIFCIIFTIAHVT